MVFQGRIVDLRHLWEPSREYKGKAQEKPSWFSAIIVPKTQADWRFEPALQAVAEACRKIWQNAQHVNRFPVSDGDLPNAEGKSSEWARGHWILPMSTSNPPNVEIVQPGGNLVKLANKALMLPGGQLITVKAGDFVTVGGTCAIAQNDPGRVKSYLNAVVFTGAGAEIMFANQVSGAELMRAAQAQGMQPTGFAPAAGMQSPGGAPGGWGGPQQGGFTPPSPAFAPTPGAPAFGAPGQAAGPATAPFTNGAPGSGTAFPSNGAPQAPFGSVAPGTPPYGAPGGMPANGGQFPSNSGQPAPQTAYPSNPATVPQWGAPQPQLSTPPGGGWPQR